MTRRSKRRGMTLVEILLALIVMVLGVVGILALFPAAMQSGRESMEETNAAIFGESVAQGLVSALRQAYQDPTSLKWKCTLAHDLNMGGPSQKYTFILPQIAPIDPEWKHFPSSQPPPPDDVGGLPQMLIEDDTRLFAFGGDPWVSKTVQYVQNMNDPTDAYKQFAFSFDISKIYFLKYLEGKPIPNQPGKTYTVQILDGMQKLYEFRIHVFRTYSQPSGFGGGTGTGSTTTTGGSGSGSGTTAGGGGDLRKLIATVTKRISTH